MNRVHVRFGGGGKFFVEELPIQIKSLCGKNTTSGLAVSGSVIGSKLN